MALRTARRAVLFYSLGSKIVVGRQSLVVGKGRRDLANDQ